MERSSGEIGRVYDQMTDRELVETYAARRDVRAFGVFVERHEGALLAFAAALLRDEALAQDMVQEAFLRAARYPERMGDGAGRNWLLKVVRDLSVDILRRKDTERRALAGKSRLSAADTGAPADAPAEAREEAGRVAAALERLRPRLRELLLLKVHQDKSYKEIAAITGLSVTNVGFLLHEAMQALAAELKE